MKSVPPRFFVVFISVFALISLVGVMFIGHSPSGWVSPLSIRAPDASYHGVYLLIEHGGESSDFQVLTVAEREELGLTEEMLKDRGDYYGWVGVQRMSGTRLVAPFIVRTFHRLSVRLELSGDHWHQEALSEGLRIASRETRVNTDVPFFAEDQLQITFSQPRYDSIILPGRTRPVLSPQSLLLLYGTAPFALAWIATAATTRAKQAHTSPPPLPTRQQFGQ